MVDMNRYVNIYGFTYNVILLASLKLLEISKAIKAVKLLKYDFKFRDIKFEIWDYFPS